MLKKKLHVIISGRVQGVFFRVYTKEKAEALNLSGWIRNLSNGQVEAVFEGNKKNLDEMLTWCYKGSPLSNVEKVEFTFGEAEGIMGFEITN